MIRNKWRRSLRMGIIGLWMLGSAPLMASDSNPSTNQNASLQRWQNLSPDQRKELLENYHQFNALTPAQRADLRKRWQEFQSLSPDQRKHILEAYRHFKSLPPEKQEKIRKNWKRWQSLSPEEQSKLQADFDAPNNTNSASPKPHSQPHKTSPHKK
jgi:hypothetical protein